MSDALLPDAPSALSRLLKLCCNASSVELDELDELESDVLEPDALWLEDDDNCWIRLCKPPSSLLIPPP